MIPPILLRLDDYPDSNWCPDCGEPRGVCRCDPNEMMPWEDYDDDNGYCDLCGGEGIIITCADDICVGGGHCIHGDGEEICPKCFGGY